MGLPLPLFLYVRGVRQGDPLFPCLFIIAFETFAKEIRSGRKIQGFKLGEEIVKLSSFADDMTCFLRDRNEYAALFHILERFGNKSGLRVNHEKKKKKKKKKMQKKPKGIALFSR